MSKFLAFLFVAALLSSPVMADQFYPMGTARALISDTETVPVRADSSTHNIISLDQAHHEAHDGELFSYSGYDLDLDSGETIEVVLVTPNTDIEQHILYTVGGALQTVVQAYEGCTHTIGSTYEAYNHNRRSSNTTTLTLAAVATDGSDGTLIYSTGFGTATGVGATRVTGGGSARGDNEWILKKNTKYLFRITSQTDNNSVNFNLSWYEHTRKD